MKATRGNEHIVYETKFQLMTAFLSETMETENTETSLECWKKNKSGNQQWQHRIPHSSNTVFTNEGEIRIFSAKRKPGWFITNSML